MSAINAMPAANTSQNQIGVEGRSAGLAAGSAAARSGAAPLAAARQPLALPDGLRLLGFFLADRPRGSRRLQACGALLASRCGRQLEVTATTRE